MAGLREWYNYYITPNAQSKIATHTTIICAIKIHLCLKYIASGVCIRVLYHNYGRNTRENEPGAYICKCTHVGVLA